MAAMHIEMVAVAPPYQAAEIKVAKFPAPADISTKLRVFLTTLMQAASNGGMNSDVFLQNEFLANGRAIVNPKMPEWKPQTGLGVWPDRPPPELWKVSDLFRMARGERIPLTHQVLRVTAGPKANSQAFSLVLGTGMIVSVLHGDSSDDLLARYKQTYLPTIKEESLRILPFYAPLLDLKSLHTSRGDDLSKWLGGARLYLRESPGDSAILIVTNIDLADLLGRAGARKDGQNHWLID